MKRRPCPFKASRCHKFVTWIKLAAFYGDPFVPFLFFFFFLFLFFPPRKSEWKGTRRNRNFHPFRDPDLRTYVTRDINHRLSRAKVAYRGRRRMSGLAGNATATRFHRVGYARYACSSVSLCYVRIFLTPSRNTLSRLCEHCLVSRAALERSNQGDDGRGVSVGDSTRTC